MLVQILSVKVKRYQRLVIMASCQLRGVAKISSKYAWVQLIQQYPNIRPYMHKYVHLGSDLVS